LFVDVNINKKIEVKIFIIKNAKLVWQEIAGVE
jgi:hypothetical protein